MEAIIVLAGLSNRFLKLSFYIGLCLVCWRRARAAGIIIDALIYPSMISDMSMASSANFACGRGAPAADITIDVLIYLPIISDMPMASSADFACGRGAPAAGVTFSCFAKKK